MLSMQKTFGAILIAPAPVPFCCHLYITADDSTTTGPTADEVAAEAQWQKDKQLARSLLTQKIPDDTLLCIHAKTTVKLRWDVIVLD